MSLSKKTIIRGGLEALYFSGAHALLQPFCGGAGAILMLHHVRPASHDPFHPNRMLEITPEFLEQVILQLRSAGLDLITLDEMRRRLTENDLRRKFACVTFDDGYRDVKVHAYPILQKHDVPFAIYVPTAFPDRTGQLWWSALEAVIAKADRIEAVVDGRVQRFDCATLESKHEVFETLYWRLRELPDEAELQTIMYELCARHDVDMLAICGNACMSWSELAELAADPLVTIGAHTVNHVSLAKQPERIVRDEMCAGRARLEAALGIEIVHFSYPYGDRSAAGPREFRIAAEFGFKTAVTTRPGVMFAEHRDHMTSLPRISLNGDYQETRYLRVLMSGAATVLWNGFRRVDTA